MDWVFCMFFPHLCCVVAASVGRIIEGKGVQWDSAYREVQQGTERKGEAGTLCQRHAQLHAAPYASPIAPCPAPALLALTHVLYPVPAVFVRDRSDKPMDRGSDGEVNGPVGHHFSVDVMLENRPDPGLKSFRHVHNIWGVVCGHWSLEHLPHIQHHARPLTSQCAMPPPPTLTHICLPSISHIACFVQCRLNLLFIAYEHANNNNSNSNNSNNDNSNSTPGFTLRPPPPPPGSLFLRFTCRAEDHKWVTDRNFQEDDIGLLKFWDTPYHVYNRDTCRAFDTMYELLTAIKEIDEVNQLSAK